VKTLIVNGSPKLHGDTAALVDAFTQQLKGEVKIITPRDNIAPCNDCRRCWQRPGCAIEDGMQAVYRYLESCDAVVLASPIWFSALSGPTLTMASRLQTYYAARRFRGAPPLRKKRGVLILAGAEKGTETAPAATARTVLRLMGADRESLQTVFALDTDNLPASRDTAALEQARAAAEALNAEMTGGCPLSWRL